MASLLLAICLTTFVQAEVVPINHENVAYVYEVNTKNPAPRETLAKLISAEYRDAKDETSAREAFTKIAPSIDKGIEAAKTSKLCLVKTTKELPQYDSKSASFPTGFTEDTFLPFKAYNQEFAVMFTNSGEFAQVPVSAESAKKLDSILEKDRSAEFTVEGFVKGTTERTLKGKKQKVILLEITMVRIELVNGTSVGAVGRDASGDLAAPKYLPPPATIEHNKPVSEP